MKLVVETVAPPTSCSILSNLGIVRATKTMERHTPVRHRLLDKVTPAYTIGYDHLQMIQQILLTRCRDNSYRLFENQVDGINDDEHCSQDMEGH